jgi:ABC-2 type transport system permease protein
MLHLDRTATLIGREVRMGYRAPFLVWALVIPVVMTLLVQGIFGSLLGRPPSLGIVDQGASAIPAEAAALDGIEVVTFDDADELATAVENHDVDAGLVLQPGFDQAVASGAQPTLQFTVAGESLASDRAILAVTTLDLVRGVEGTAAPVTVDVVQLGEVGLDLASRLIPMLVVMAVAIGGALVPAAGLVEERERRTLDAVLVTPASLADVFASKLLIGLVVAIVSGTLTLALNGVWGSAPWALVAAVAIGGLMMAEIGLAVGSWARDQNTLFAVWKAGAILLIYPVVFFIWPDLPEWIAMVAPTWWFLDPIFSLALEGATFADVAGSLAVALAWCVALVPVVVLMGRRLERVAGEQ